MKLGNAHLQDMPEGVLVPNYNRANLTAGIVHIGVGNFHRAHQSWYLHRLMQAGQALDWAIVGAGVRAYDANMRDKLRAQDCLTTLIELSPKGTAAEIIGSMIDYLPIEEGNGALIRQMAEPAIRIVSLTITEGGYFIDSASGGLNVDEPDIRHDVAHPNRPVTVFGAIVAALSARRATGAGPVTVLSCDNLRRNGDITQNCVVTLARMVDPALADWIEETCSFPNSMVDCIVPATGATERAKALSLGIEDAAPVTHENYRQWVIEDAFCAGRPELENVGVILTADVHDFEAMKIRILNAGHQVLANAGELMSLNSIAQCMAHPLVSDFFRTVEQEEIVPFVADVTGMTASAYADLIAARFANPEIRDTTRRVAFDGSSRHPEFVLPIIRDALDAGKSVRGLALVEALWARMCAGTRDDGTRIEGNDPNWATLNATALVAHSTPRAWLEQRHIYDDLADVPAFAEVFSEWLSLIWKDGCARALTAYLEERKPVQREIAQ